MSQPALLKDLEARMQAATDALTREFAGVRTGRANASQMKEIEKGIAKSDLGLSPSNDGKVIRLTVPTLTEERRKQLAKQIGKFAEDARVAIRTARREANDKLKSLAKDKKVSEDEERRGHDQIQKTTDRFAAKIGELAKKKEQEVMTV